MMIHLQLCRIVEQNCATICQSPCMSWPSVSYDHDDHDPRSSFFIATFIIISLHVFSSMINTIPIICIWPAPEDDEQGSLPSSHEFFVPTMTELSKQKSGNPWQQHFVPYSLPHSEMRFANSGHQMFNLVKSTWGVSSWKVICDGCRMGFSGCKNWLEESYNCTQNEAGDVEIKRLQNCEQNEEKWKIKKTSLLGPHGGESISIW